MIQTDCMTQRTRTFQLVEERLGRDLADHVRTLRDDGASWVTVCHELADETGVRLTPETIRVWFAADETVTARAS